ncbi:MAG: DHHW family protein [Clostridia bacterium]
MNDKIKRIGAIITSVVFLTAIVGLSVANILYIPPEISKSERRYLATFPEFTFETIINKKFMQGFEKYAPDSFVARDAFRAAKAFSQYNLLFLKDSNGIYTAEGHAAKLIKENDDSVSLLAKNVQKLIEKMPSVNAYFSLIPDKGYYLAEKNGYIPMNYALMEKILKDGIKDARFIDLFPVLGIDDFYNTDLHWRQERLEGVVALLSESIGFSTDFDYEKTDFHGFYGAYLGQSALTLKSETLSILRSSSTESAKVKLLNPKTMKLEEATMYDLEAYTGIDPYDIYLHGAQAVITIENPNADTDKSLTIFRDSFSSSLTPLITCAYSSITLIDLRYINAGLAMSMFPPERGSDVLFIYGVEIINNAGTMLF